jgi:ankyrin repeat protein
MQVAPFTDDPLGTRAYSSTSALKAASTRAAPSRPSAVAHGEQIEDATRIEPPPDAAPVASAAPAAAPEATILVPMPPGANPSKEFLRAVKDGNLAAVRACWEAHQPELDLERRSMWENTPLTCAAYYGHEDVALQLLQLGADPHAQNEHGCTALLFAAVEGMPRLMRALLSLEAVRVDPPAAVVYNRATDETAPRTPLHAAAERGFAEGVELLLARGAAAVADEAGPNPLALAARQGHAQVCAMLLRAGASALPAPPPAEGSSPSPLRSAIAHGHAEAALAIVEHTPRAVSAEPQLLLLSVAKGLASVCQALIAAGADVQARADDGSESTALHVAARRNDAEAARMLVDAGALLSETNHDGRTAEQVAALHGHEQVRAQLELAARAAAGPAGTSARAETLAGVAGPPGADAEIGTSQSHDDDAADAPASAD